MNDEEVFYKIESCLSHCYDLGRFDGKNGSCLKDNIFELAEQLQRWLEAKEGRDHQPISK